VDSGAAVALLGRLRSLHELDKLASRLPGLCHLSASVDGQTRVQGSVTGVRQIFTAEAGGVSVAASGVAPLLELTGGGQLDGAMLAARLLTPSGPPWPLAQRTVRRGVRPLATGHWLLLDADGRPAPVRWWDLPPASRSLPEAADALRGALTDSLTARVSLSGTITADLSGGLDSTCLCFLAAAADANLVTYHLTPLDTANEDTPWAEKAAALLPSARHQTLPADRAANWFSAGYDPAAPDTDPEGPATWASGLAHVRDLAARAAAEGAAVHLTGFGGDELFGRMPACPWSLARARPVSGLRLVNRYRLANRWSYGGTVRSLLDRSTFADNLAALAGRIGDPPRPVSEPDFGWTFTPRMPPWATKDAVTAVRQLLAEAAVSGPRPLDSDRTRHQALASLVFEGSTIRQLNTVIAGTGISWDAPLLDDRVIEAALSARVDERLAGGRYKPLLTSAMRDVVPADILGRRDKGEFSAEGFRGLTQNRQLLLDLCEDSRLAGLGLIDVAAFRAALLSPGLMSQDLQPIQTTVACESWLRSHSWHAA
jgi:asparagine synthase (glutamine-hydrolysing)